MKIPVSFKKQKNYWDKAKKARQMKLSQDKNWDGGLKVVATIALLLFGDKLLANARKKKVESEMDTNPAAGQAASLNQAMNPWGFKLAWYFDGTDKDAIFRIASQITNLDDVATAYKGITGDSVYDDLESSLSPDEYQKFLSITTKNKVGSWYFAPKSDKVPFNHWVITTADANVRNSPKYYTKMDFLKFKLSNVVLLAPRGMKLGASTGKYTYDEKNKILFVEFWTFTTKGQKKTFFVAKSQIEFVSQAELAKREKQGKIPLQIIEGLEGAENEPQQEVISTETTIVYDENFNQIGLTAKDITMGFPIMTLNTGKGNYIKFQTIQGAKRWIRAESAKIIDRRF